MSIELENLFKGHHNDIKTWQQLSNLNPRTTVERNMNIIIPSVWQWFSPRRNIASDNILVSKGLGEKNITDIINSYMHRNSRLFSQIFTSNWLLFLLRIKEHSTNTTGKEKTELKLTDEKPYENSKLTSWFNQKVIENTTNTKSSW